MGRKKKRKLRRDKFIKTTYDISLDSQIPKETVEWITHADDPLEYVPLNLSFGSS